MFVHHPRSGVNTLSYIEKPLLRRRIREAMRDRGIPSVVALSKRARVTRNTIYNWESGVTVPALDQLEEVAKTLAVPLSFLVDAWSGREHTNAAPAWWAGAAKTLVDQLKKEMMPKSTDELADPETVQRIAAAVADKLGLSRPSDDEVPDAESEVPQDAPHTTATQQP